MIKSEKPPGFTLVELLVALSVSAVIMTAVYAAYRSQQKSYGIQEEVAALQQDLRAAMFYMTSQIREAGCNPSSNPNKPGILTADVDEIHFTSDVRGTDFGTDPNGNTNDPHENITYSLYTSGGIQKLGIKSTADAVIQPVIENVEALNFVYLDQNRNRLDDDGSGNVTINIPNIRSVEVTIVVRASRGRPGLHGRQRISKPARGRGFGSTKRSFSPQNDEHVHRRPKPGTLRDILMPFRKKYRRREKASLCPGNHCGFTLLEVLLAMFVLAFGILAVGSMQVNSIRQNAYANQVTAASVLARDRLEGLVALVYTDAVEDPALAAGTYQDDSPPEGYTIGWKISDGCLSGCDSPLNTKFIEVTVQHARLRKNIVLMDIKPKAPI
jgi:type IV pilus assembly protein PilW